MDKKKSISSSSLSSSSSSSFDHIFGPRVTSSSSSSSSSSGLFQTIFPPPSIGAQRNRNEAAKYQPPNSRVTNIERGERRKNKERKSYQNDQEIHPPCNLSSSIYYGGQDNYSSSTQPPQSTTNPDPYKKAGEEGDPEGNWWEGKL
ncbi:unnamed protein product [Cochlearia groenlandica]